MDTAPDESENWFRDWFSSPYYQILYRHRDRDEARGFIHRLMECTDIPKGGLVLDLACGAGRHSVELHGLGYRVVGIDLSEESIEEARQYETDGLEFFVHDMRSLYWVDHFDAVLNLFTSFGYFHSPEQDQRTISGVSHALRPGGVFVLDFLNVQRALACMVGEERLSREGLEFIIQRSRQGNVIEKRITVLDGDAEMVFKEEVDILTLQDFERYFEIAGLELIALYGSYDLDPFDEAVSDRLIMVTRKNAPWEI